MDQSTITAVLLLGPYILACLARLMVLGAWLYDLNDPDIRARVWLRIIVHVFVTLCGAQTLGMFSTELLGVIIDYVYCTWALWLAYSEFSRLLKYWSPQPPPRPRKYKRPPSGLPFRRVLRSPALIW